MGNCLNSKPQKVCQPNVLFYSNQNPASPNKENIETILNEWKGDYKKLNSNHGYIQWLFPNRKRGVNEHAFILTDDEAKKIRDTPELRERVKRAFEMMLDFYGMKLLIGNHFEPEGNHKERFWQLNQSENPNFLRITRILLSLKELGHKELMKPWMLFLAGLIFNDKILAEAEYSFREYWLDTLDTEDRLAVDEHVKNYY